MADSSNAIKLNGDREFVIDVDSVFSPRKVQIGLRHSDNDSVAEWAFLTDEQVDDLIIILQYYRVTGRVC